jgi:GH24 family phage-related lysozyme (muramidase)
MTNSLSERGAAFVAAHEGFVPRWYLDPVGIPTIGYGFTERSRAFRQWWKANRPGIKFDRGATMTRAECEAVLRLLVQDEYGAAVNSFLGKKVPQHVFDAMASVAFNAGPGSLAWTWAREAKAGNYAAAAERLKTTAVTAKGPNGKRVTLPGLVRRRAEEAALLLHGDYAGVKADQPKPGADNVLSRGSRGGRVMVLQSSLKGAGFDPGLMDGHFGVGTQSAVMAFQRANNLKADGVVGPATWAALEAKREHLPIKGPEDTYTPPAKPAGGNTVAALVARWLRMIVKGSWK